MGQNHRDSWPNLADNWSCANRNKKHQAKTKNTNGSVKTLFSAWPLWGACIAIIIFAFIVFASFVFSVNLSELVFAFFSIFIIFTSILRLIAMVLPAPQMRDYKLPQDKSKWPFFTILVPIYKEAHMVKPLMMALSKLDYPQTKMRIIMVCEQDDIDTCNAVKRNLQPPFEIFETPPSHPRTKPKALNAAMRSLAPAQQGDIISIYDAEDRPHPKQLQQAACALLADKTLAAVQAPLGYYNYDENLLTRLFSLEYAALFHVFNPALARLGLPFTLGGTSNHVKLSSLKTAGGWDSYNVTEDADLSFRLNALKSSGYGWRISTITPPTDEEALSSVKAWQNQRSRWLKGFMQTALVHARINKTTHSGHKYKLPTWALGILAQIITIYSTLLLAFLHIPSLIILAVMAIAEFVFGFDNIWQGGIWWIMFLGYGSSIAICIIGAMRAKKPDLIIYAFLLPFYWLLFFQPAILAIREMIFAPSYWRKTTHRNLVDIGSIDQEIKLNESDKPALAAKNKLPV